MSSVTFADSPRNGAWGDRPYSITDITGPASYTAIANGTAPAACTGGQALAASQFGLKNLEGVVMISGSTSGTYVVEAFQQTGYYQGRANPTWALRWITAATGAEVSGATNLSGEQVRLLAFGPY